jgi:Flp pilus assembly secretin CpaC
MTSIRATLMAAAVCTTFASATARAGEPDDPRNAPMSVTYDQSTLWRLDRPVKTVIVGNPAIADAQLVNANTIYVLGRMFGNTNIIAIDADGAEVANRLVSVGGAEVAQVTLYRGPNGQRNMACAPRCERTLTQGDAEVQAMYQDADKKVDSSQKAASLSR